MANTNKNTNRNASGAKAKNTAKKSEQAKVPDITVRIDRLIDDEETNVKAYASVNVGGAFAVHGLKVIDSKNGLFVNMPSRPFKDENGVTRYADYFHAVTADARNALNDAVLNEYGRAFAQAQSESEDEDFEEIEDESEGLSPKM